MDSLFSTDLESTPTNSVAGGNLFETVLESAQRQLQLSFSPSQGLGVADLVSHFRAKTGVDHSLTLFPGSDLSQSLSRVPVSRFADDINIFTPLRRSLPSSDALIGASASRAVADPLVDPKGKSESSDSPGALLMAPADNAGNTLAAARNIGALSSTQTFSDWVGSADTNDYYRFNLTQASSFNLTLNGLSADADVQLLNSSGTVLQSSVNAGTASETITRSLTAGDYYVRVFRYSGDTTYNLALSATVSVPADNAGNTLATARNIGALSSTQTFSDWVGSADTNDYYRFSLAQTSTFNLTLNGLSADADVQLLNSSGAVLQSSTNAGTTAESITSQSLTAGDYYVRVFPYSGNTNYNLALSATASIPADNAGNTLATARNIGTLSSTQTFSDWVGSADTNDYYRFSLAQTSTFNLTLNGLSANADVQLLNSGGTVLQSSTNAGTTAESITSQSLTAGDYYVRVFPNSGSTNNTSYSLAVSATAVVPPNPLDWFGQNLRDAELISLTRSLAADGNLSRNDMISIFRNAEDGNTIDANELTDLRTLVANASRFTMADSVRVLSNKIANSDPANPRSGIGNLSAGSSATQMESLIGKWFLGINRPTLTSSSYTYQYANGSLFQNGAGVNDIVQGAVGDCYYLATLSSIAQEKPSYIQDMFTDNGDNTFAVRFFNNGAADYVTVDRYLPTNSSGYKVYAGWGGGSVSSSSNELWVALAEKAYAQLAESGWSRPSTPNNAYTAIEGGWMDTVIRQVTGLAATSQSIGNMNQTQLINLVNSNQILTAGFVYGAGYGVVNGHAYTVTAYNSANGTFHLRNPWGVQDADVTWAQLVSLSAIVQWSNT
ncbi:MAG: pre-peptidase C-terminal domain-containing protein [Cyanobacteria bacterium REEB459]|nr:pre-peptidase C-terminal domain-containing protein [Cyanobacteria bacterium REEB459]